MTDADPRTCLTQIAVELQLPTLRKGDKWCRRLLYNYYVFIQGIDRDLGC